MHFNWLLSIVVLLEIFIFTTLTWWHLLWNFKKAKKKKSIQHCLFLSSYRKHLRNAGRCNLWEDVEMVAQRESGASESGKRERERVGEIFTRSLELGWQDFLPVHRVIWFDLASVWTGLLSLSVQSLSVLDLILPPPLLSSLKWSYDREPPSPFSHSRIGDESAQC